MAGTNKTDIPDKLADFIWEEGRKEAQINWSDITEKEAIKLLAERISELEKKKAENKLTSSEKNKLKVLKAGLTTVKSLGSLFIEKMKNADRKVWYFRKFKGKTTPIFKWTPEEKITLKATMDESIKSQMLILRRRFKRPFSYESIKSQRKRLKKARLT